MSLEITDLTIDLRGRRVVDGVSLALADGERLGLIGESGSGKSLTALAVLGLLPRGAVVGGSIVLDGVELVGQPDARFARLRGRDAAIVFQEPATALNPVRTVGAQIAEPLRIHYGLSRAQARERVVRLAKQVALPDPERLIRQYPHQLSGGQRQRVAIAIALSTSPRLLIADEPTTALDVTIQAGILELFDGIVRDSGASLLFITHDFSVLSQIAARAVVLAEGRVIEHGSVAEILHEGRHRVTRALADAARATSWTEPAE
ncbi:ABC transporter ATP-binding protein [Microbacterium sp. SORGH_AS_0862]|uniref:ABC transporter ATP-binding protein n=1 Tax=Microbacterium sp. SORGH_AS_0862 TaxID=3041789 RepID=UPI00278EB32A|nr:ABC transporter ATP-binding protein [Microbacterium sp. SORGH_AS_0862]MDQ1205716.1 peptide/nickel transport system ATP-binding protein [Microbacterium sp. SORGH_AS_0862]